jgi:hypothetical protein
MEHVRDSPKLNMFCTMSMKKVYCPFFFKEMNVTNIINFDCLQTISSHSMPKFIKKNTYVFPARWRPSHFHGKCTGVSACFTDWWVG